MAPKPNDRIEKKWVVKQLRHFTSLKTIAGVQKYQKTLLKRLEDEEDTKTRSVRQYLTKPIHSKITFAYEFS
jgi:hypothetical protein